MDKLLPSQIVAFLAPPAEARRRRRELPGNMGIFLQPAYYRRFFLYE